MMNQFEILKAQRGAFMGRSNWIEITAEMITTHAHTTYDTQYIHTDGERAAQSPFCGVVAHGFLSLSLLVAMYNDVMASYRDEKMLLNYGLNKVRFLKPVPAGARVAGDFTLRDVVQKHPDAMLLYFDVEVVLEKKHETALIAEWILLRYF